MHLPQNGATSFDPQPLWGSLFLSWYCFGVVLKGNKRKPTILRYGRSVCSEILLNKKQDRTYLFHWRFHTPGLARPALIFPGTKVGCDGHVSLRPRFLHTFWTPKKVGYVGGLLEKINGPGKWNKTHLNLCHPFLTKLT